MCLFYYCLYNSFLFIEHSSMSVKCLFFLSERAKSFLYVEREQSSMYWAIEKYKHVDKQLFGQTHQNRENMNSHSAHICIITLVLLI